MEWRHTTIDRNYNCWWCKMQRKGEDWTLGFATVWRKEWVLLKTYGMWELAIELNVEPGHLIRSAGSPHLILIHESWALLCKPSPVSQSPFALFLFPPPALFFWLGNKLKLWKKVSMTSSKKKKNTQRERELIQQLCSLMTTACHHWNSLKSDQEGTAIRQVIPKQCQKPTNYWSYKNPIPTDFCKYVNQRCWKCYVIRSHLSL